MKIILLGTGGYHPSELRHTACMMIPSEGIVLDAGTAMFRVRDHIATDSLDILLSHAHLDHVMGLTFMFDVLYKRDVSRVTVHVEESKIEPLKAHLFAQELFPVDPPFEFSPLSKLDSLGANGRLTTFPLEHPGGATGFRLDWPDRSLAYVTDTVARPDAPYIDAIQGVDLLIHECYFGDDNKEYAIKTGHSCTTPVAQVAKQAGVGRLAVVHVNPVLNELDPVNIETIREIFPESILGTDNLEIDF